MMLIKKKKGFTYRNFINYRLSNSDALVPRMVTFFDKLYTGFYTRSEELTSFGVYAGKSGMLFDKNIDVCIKLVKRTTKRMGRFESFVFANNAYTSKPSETRMGKGKGKFEGNLVCVQRGQLLFTFSDVPANTAMDVLRALSKKLPFQIVLRKM